LRAFQARSTADFPDLGLIPDAAAGALLPEIFQTFFFMLDEKP